MKYQFKNTNEIPVQKRYEKMSTEQTMALMGIMTSSREVRESLIRELVRESEASIFTLLYKRVKHFKLEDRITNEALIFMDILSNGNPGRAVFMLIDVLNYAEEHKVIVDLSILAMNIYPDGFYTPDYVQEVVDSYVKNGQLKNSNIY